jgi:hypothetical protein
LKEVQYIFALAGYRQAQWQRTSKFKRDHGKEWTLKCTDQEQGEV